MKFVIHVISISISLTSLWVHSSIIELGFDSHLCACCVCEFIKKEKKSQISYCLDSIHVNESLNFFFGIGAHNIPSTFWKVPNINISPHEFMVKVSSSIEDGHHQPYAEYKLYISPKRNPRYILHTFIYHFLQIYWMK